MLAIGIGGNTLTGYNITDSLRFRSSASAYLTRTPTSAGNRKTFTISCWVKRSKLGATQRLFQAKDSASGAYEGIEINSSDQFKLRHHSGAFYEVTTTQVFRDTSAWYHLVATVDTTQATSSNRIKLYVNGEQVTSFATASYPAQNYDFPINDTQEHTIGTYPTGGGEFFDGYMTEVNFVDGQALTASDFGETNTDGVWSPKEYTGTYGTNGFYLPMKETTQATGFNTVLYTATGTDNLKVEGVGFSPDFVWIKSRDGARSHMLYDTVRGATNRLASESTTSEASVSDGLKSFDTDGFTLGTHSNNNTSGEKNVAWCWDAGSSTVSNTDGTITSSVRANPASGFSIVSYTGTGTNGATIGHGLGSAPDMIIVKNRDVSTSSNWSVYHSGVDATAPEDYALLLNSTTAKVNTNLQWNDTAPTASVFTLGTENDVNNSGSRHIAYCFSEVAGFSKFGSYTGNGSTSGPTVTTGFRPAWIMFKRTDNVNGWYIWDNTRTVNNPRGNFFKAETSDAENSADIVNFTDTGFEIISNSSAVNTSGGTYIYMAFADTRDYQWNFDSSGNKNNLTPNNINSNASSETTYDLMSDVPHATDEDTGNFATLNPLVIGDGGTMSDGNLTFTTPTATRGFHAGTIGMTSGKWYWEVTCSASTFNSTNRAAIGYKLGNERSSYVISGTDGDVGNIGFYIGDTVGFAFDADNGTLENFINGVSNATVSSIDMTKTWFPIGADAHTAQNGTVHWNFGQRPFKYTPPTGYKKLNTFNLPDSTITDGSQYFDVDTWSGDSSATTQIATPFSPDFVWIKNRSNTGGSGAASHMLYDTVRGVQKELQTNLTNAEGTLSTGLNSFDSDGYKPGTSTRTNATGNTYVGWAWRASDSTAVSNTDGTITSTVSANTTSGFSVVTYTGNKTAGATIGHGLGSAPSVIIVKNRSASQNWAVYHSSNTSAPETDWLKLNLTDATADLNTIWNDTAPTSSVFTVGTADVVNGSGNDMVAYCFAEVEGFSKLGSYTGNGSTDGPFVHTGFRPAFILVKRTDNFGDWIIIDNQRIGYNPETYLLEPNSSDAEYSTDPNYKTDLLSNGFKYRNTAGRLNGSGASFIYMAFAENPFKNSLAR